MNHAIRAMTIADFDAVLRLWQDTAGVGLNESDDRQNLAAFLARNPGMSRVAAAGTEIVGAVLCGHDGRRGYLHHLAVAGACRQRGLGRQLVETCLADLTGRGILKCNIFLFSDNAAGEAFWIHNGWAKRSDLQIMQKSLAAVETKSGCQT
jgi:N-acetylglutamate synthase